MSWDDDDDDQESPQTFLFPTGTVIKEKWGNETFTVMGYVTYQGDIFHILLDEYMQEFDTFIDSSKNWIVLGEAA